MVPKPGQPKKHTNEGTQIKKKDPIRCKSAKCHNECYKYQTTKCQEQHDKLHNSQHGKENVQELKERNYRSLFRKREHKCWNNREDTCLNLYRVINEDTSGNPVNVDKNGKIYNSIYNFKEGIPTIEKMADLFEMRIMCKEEKCNRYELLATDRRMFGNTQ